MPGTWKVSVQFDADQPDVGSVSATWTEPIPVPAPDPLPVPATFTYSERIKATVAGGNTFVARAIAARNAWQAKSTANTTKTDWVLAALNAADPKAKV